MNMRLVRASMMVGAMGAVAVCALGQAPIVRQAPPRSGPVLPSPGVAPTGACTVEQALQAEDRQDFNGAIRVYQCLSQKDPQDWRPVNSAAGVYGLLNRPADEVVWAERAIKLAPQQPEPYVNLGNAQAAQKNFAAAQASFQKAAQVDPKSPLGPYSLAVLAEVQKNPQEAERQYRRAIAIAPDDEDAEVALAAFLGNNGRLPEAIQILQKVVKDDPQAQGAKQMLYDMQHGGPKRPPQGGPGQPGPQQGAPMRQ
jgi:tetratricopeptide (TPR) repeat protein